MLGLVRKEFHSWSVVVLKTKAIYHTLNKFNMDVTKKCLIGECWVPTDDLAKLRRALDDGGVSAGAGAGVGAGAVAIGRSLVFPGAQTVNVFTWYLLFSLLFFRSIIPYNSMVFFCFLTSYLSF